MDFDPNHAIHPAQPPVSNQAELDQRKLTGQLEEIGETLEEINKKLAAPNIVAWVTLISLGLMLVIFVASIIFGLSLAT